MNDMAGSNFVDYVKIFARSGHGGGGSTHFRREKFVAFGGPDGGDGGKGGSIVLQGDKQYWTLIHLKYQRHQFAEDGEHGSGARSSGKDARDIVIPVPLGTVAKRVFENEDGTATTETVGEVTAEHTVEDTGIVMGQALREALGDKRGIRRFGSVIVPLDEALVMAAVDISGRGELFWDVAIGPDKVGTFDTELGHEFFAGLARDAGITLHLRLVCGENAHHIMEATFKAFARALRMAVGRQGFGYDIPSSKGVL